MSEMNISEFVTTVKSWGKIIKTAVLGIGVLLSSYLVPKLTMDRHQETTGNEQQQSAAATPLTGNYAPATTPTSSPPLTIGMPSVTFTVMSTGQSKTGKKFLNSTADYKQPGNQTVVLEGAATGLDVNTLKGRTITAYGKASEYKGKPQITVTDLAGVQVR